jgi:hypothetical protein
VYAALFITSRRGGGSIFALRGRLFLTLGGLFLPPLCKRGRYLFFSPRFAMSQHRYVGLEAWQ